MQYNVITSLPSGTSVFVLAQKGISGENDMRADNERFWLNVAIERSDGKIIYGWVVSTAVVLNDNQPPYAEGILLWIDLLQPQQVDQERKVLVVERSFDVLGWTFDGRTPATDNSAGIYSITIYKGNSCTAQNGIVLATGIPSIPRIDVVDAFNSETVRNFFRVNLRLDESHINNGYALRVENMERGRHLIAICAQSRADGRVVAWVLPIEVR